MTDIAGYAVDGWDGTLLYPQRPYELTNRRGVGLGVLFDAPRGEPCEITTDAVWAVDDGYSTLDDAYEELQGQVVSVVPPTGRDVKALVLRVRTRVYRTVTGEARIEAVWTLLVTELAS